MHILHVLYMYMEMELVYDKNILTLTGNVRNSCQKSDHQNNPNSHLQHIKRPNCEEQRALLKSAYIWRFPQPYILLTRFSDHHCQHNMLLNSSETLLTDVCLLYILYKAKKHHVKYGENIFKYKISKNRFCFK